MDKLSSKHGACAISMARLCSASTLSFTITAHSGEPCEVLQPKRTCQWEVLIWNTAPCWDNDLIWLWFYGALFSETCHNNVPVCSWLLEWGGCDTIISSLADNTEAQESIGFRVNHHGLTIKQPIYYRVFDEWKADHMTLCWVLWHRPPYYPNINLMFCSLMIKPTPSYEM